MNTTLEKSLKRYLKRKVKYTISLLIVFLMTGGIALSEDNIRRTYSNSTQVEGSIEAEIEEALEYLFWISGRTVKFKSDIDKAGFARQVLEKMNQEGLLSEDVLEHLQNLNENIPESEIEQISSVMNEIAVFAEENNIIEKEETSSNDEANFAYSINIVNDEILNNEIINNENINNEIINDEIINK